MDLGLFWISFRYLKTGKEEMNLGWDSQLQFLWDEKMREIQTLWLLLDPSPPPLTLVGLSIVVASFQLSHDEEVLLAQRGGVEAQVRRQVRLCRLCTRALQEGWQYQLVVASSRDASLTLVILHASIAKFKFANISLHSQNALATCNLAPFFP